MSQVKIYGLRLSLDEHRQGLSDAIHSAIVDGLAYPVEKRFHRFVGLDKADFLFPQDRSHRYTIIEISMFEGRTIETKKRLVKLLYHRISDQTGIEPQDIEITIFETPRHAWGIRGQSGDEIGLNYDVSV